MHKRFGSVLILSIVFAVVLNPVMEFGRSFQIDHYYGTSVFTDLAFAATSAILGVVMGAGLWWADSRARRWPLVVLPAGVLFAAGIGYGSTAYAFGHTSSRYTILTDDCYYDDALVYKSTGGIFVSSGGKTAFHPFEQVRSIQPLPSQS